MSVWLGTALALFFLLAPPVEARVYRNYAYGYRFVEPIGLRMCDRVNSHYEGIEHGVEIMLDPEDKTPCESDALFRQRLVAFYASYNVFDVTKTFDAYVRDECDNIMGGHCAPGPNGLHIAGLKSAALQANHRDGGIEVHVLALAGLDPDVGYDVSLYTDAGHFEKDLRMFRTMLNSLRVPH